MPWRKPREKLNHNPLFLFSVMTRNRQRWLVKSNERSPPVEKHRSVLHVNHTNLKSGYFSLLFAQVDFRRLSMSRQLCTITQSFAPYSQKNEGNSIWNHCNMVHLPFAIISEHLKRFLDAKFKEIWSRKTNTNYGNVKFLTKCHFVKVRRFCQYCQSKLER